MTETLLQWWLAAQLIGLALGVIWVIVVVIWMIWKFVIRK